MNLDILLNNFLTSGIRLADPETIRKIKILNIFHIVFIMIAPLLGLFYFYIGAVLLFFVTITAGLLMVSAVILLRKTKNVLLIGNYSIAILWGTLLIISWHTGAVTYEGVIKPSWILNAGLILFAIFLNGYLSGTIWTTVVFIETGVVIYLFRNGYRFPDLIPPDIMVTYSLGTYMICLLTILLFAFLFEKEKIEALFREKGKSEALRESKRYIDDILERSPVPTFILDKNHRVIQWNQACQEITGVPSEQVIGKGVWEGIHVDERGSLADIILEEPESITEHYGDSIISHSDTGWFELEMFMPKIKEGHRAFVTVAPILDNSGVTKGAIQTIQEIKGPNLGGQALGDKEVNQLAESLAFPIFKIDSRGKITFWNNSCIEHFGHTADDMLGKNVLSIVSKRYRSRFRDIIGRVFKGEAIYDKSLKYYNSKGKPIYVLTKAFATDSTDGGGRECVILNINITDLKIKSKRLEIYALETKEKLKNLKEEYDLLKKNIATFIRRKDKPENP